MPTKKTVKKKKSVRKKQTPTPIAQKEYSSMDVRRAKNGYVISTFNGRKSETYVAKDKREMQSISKKLLGIS